VALTDGAVLIDFGNAITETFHAAVLCCYQALLKARSPLIRDLVPAYSSLAVHYDVAATRQAFPHQPAFTTMHQVISKVLENAVPGSFEAARTLQVPVCYAPRFAPDLATLAQANHLTIEAVIDLHTAVTYKVYMLGFLPGFAYMAEVDERIATPRKQQPRTSVPEGSVGIAGRQTGIYPFNSPGGWNIIGRTPVKLFDPTREAPVFFRPGDAVRFYSITEDEFEDHQSRIA